MNAFFAAVLAGIIAGAVALYVPLSAPLSAGVASAAVLLAVFLTDGLRTRTGTLRARWRLRSALAPLRRSPAGGCVYLIGPADGQGLTKIGTTVDLKSRLRTLQCGSPVPLTVIYATPGERQLEQELHRRYASRRAHREWFDLSRADVDAIKGATA